MSANSLKRRTLTSPYNERPAWLDNAHRELNAAVAAAYGWPADIAEEEALARTEAPSMIHGSSSHASEIRPCSELNSRTRQFAPARMELVEIKPARTAREFWMIS